MWTQFFINYFEHSAHELGISLGAAVLSITCSFQRLLPARTTKRETIEISGIVICDYIQIEREKGAITSWAFDFTSFAFLCKRSSSPNYVVH